MPRLKSALVCAAAILQLAGAARAASPDVAGHHPGSPDHVLVVNPPSRPVPVQVQATDQPFHHQFSLDFPDGQGLATSTYTVPAGKTLVIEYASLSAYLPPDGQTIFVRIITTAGDGYGTSDAFHTLNIQKREDYGVLKQFEGAHAVRIYSLAGTQVRVSIGRLPFTGTASASVTLSGRLEAAP